MKTGRPIDENLVSIALAESMLAKTTAST